jgi:hypothetical protein
MRNYIVRAEAVMMGFRSPATNSGSLSGEVGSDAEVTVEENAC